MAKRILPTASRSRVGRPLVARFQQAHPVTSPLLHVGIRKAASTYLQHCFAGNMRVRIATMIPLELAIFDAALSGEPIGPFVESAKERFTPEWTRPQIPGMHHVVTNERFALNPRMMKFVPNDADAPTFYDRLWALTVGSLKQVFPDARVFIVTRAPNAWIKSAYAQAVRGAMTPHRFPGFVRCHSTYLRQNLAYDRMRDLFAREFGAQNVLFLPQELLRHDPDRFFQLLSDYAGFRLKPREVAEHAKNASPSAQELDMLVNTWRILRLLDKCGRRDGSRFYKYYVDGGVEKIERVYKMYERSAVEFRSPRGSRLLESVRDALPEPTLNVRRFDVPPAMLATLTTQCRFLLNLPGYETCTEAYAPPSV